MSHMRRVCPFIPGILKIENAIKKEKRRNRARKYKNIRYAFFHSNVFSSFSTYIKNKLRFFALSETYSFPATRRYLLRVETGVE